MQDGRVEGVGIGPIANLSCREVHPPAFSQLRERIIEEPWVVEQCDLLCRGFKTDNVVGLRLTNLELTRFSGHPKTVRERCPLWQKIEAVCRRHGYEPPIIGTPMELMED